MKKTCALLMVPIMCLSCFGALAKCDKPILFRGAEWGCTIEEAVKVLPGKTPIADLQMKPIERWYPMNEMMFSHDVWGIAKFAEELGCRYDCTPLIKENQVAGYDVSGLSLYFVYRPGENGLLQKDSTALVNACYTLNPKSSELAYDDLRQKLISLYGDVDESDQKSISGHDFIQSLWYGADGTMVSLVRNCYRDRIEIQYGFEGGNDLMQEAYDAVALEEVLNAASDVDGL